MKDRFPTLGKKYCVALLLIPIDFSSNCAEKWCESNIKNEILKKNNTHYSLTKLIAAQPENIRLDYPGVGFGEIPSLWTQLLQGENVRAHCTKIKIPLVTANNHQLNQKYSIIVLYKHHIHSIIRMYNHCPCLHSLCWAECDFFFFFAKI